MPVRRFAGCWGTSRWTSWISASIGETNRGRASRWGCLTSRKATTSLAAPTGLPPPRSRRIRTSVRIIVWGGTGHSLAVQTANATTRRGKRTSARWRLRGGGAGGSRRRGIHRAGGPASQAALVAAAPEMFNQWQSNPGPEPGARVRQAGRKGRERRHRRGSAPVGHSPSVRKSRCDGPSRIPDVRTFGPAVAHDFVQGPSAKVDHLAT